MLEKFYIFFEYLFIREPSERGRGGTGGTKAKGTRGGRGGRGGRAGRGGRGGRGGKQGREGNQGKKQRTTGVAEEPAEEEPPSAALEIAQPVFGGECIVHFVVYSVSVE